MRNVIILCLLLSISSLANVNASTESNLTSIKSVIPNSGPCTGGTEVTIFGENLDKLDHIIIGEILIDKFVDRKNNIIKFITKELPFITIKSLPRKIKIVIKKENKLEIIPTEFEFIFKPNPNYIDIDLGITFIPTMETVGHPALLFSVNPFGERFNYIVPPKNLGDFKNSFSITIGFISRIVPRFPYNKTATRLIKQDLIPVLGFGYKFSNWGRLIIGTSIFTRIDKPKTQFEPYFGISIIDWLIPIISKRTKKVYQYLE